MTKLLVECTTVAHRMELLDGLWRNEQLHQAINEAHDSGNVDEELLFQELGVILSEDLDGLGGSRLDLSGLAKEGDGFVIVDLVDLVGIVLGGDADGGGGKVEGGDCELHERNTPVEESKMV